MPNGSETDVEELTRFFEELQQSEFYGEVSIRVRKGKITLLTLTETYHSIKDARRKIPEEEEP